MDGNIVIPQRSNISQHPRQNPRIEDKIRICPLCQSEVRLFYINYSEKMLMCENTNCEYPFGHEVLQFVREDTDMEYSEEVLSYRESSSATASLVSAAAWSEIDKITRMCDMDDGHVQMQMLSLEHTKSEHKKALKLKQEEKKLQDHINDVKELNKELINQSCKEKKDVSIKNAVWIKKLNSIQEASGVKMLKPEELSLLKKEEPVLGLGELKIDIDRSVATIKIEIHNKAQASLDDSKEAGTQDVN